MNRIDFLFDFFFSFFFFLIFLIITLRDFFSGGDLFWMPAGLSIFSLILMVLVVCKDLKGGYGK